MTYEKLLSGAAVCGQLMALFPFAVLFNALGTGKYSFPVYLIIYAAWALFYGAGFAAAKAAGRICGKSESGNGAVMAVSRLAVIVPSILFIVVNQLCGFTPASYLYVLTAAILAYFGGYSSAGRKYSGKFTPLWLILYFASALTAAFLLHLSKNEELISDGTLQLCVGFAAMVVMSAVLINQTTIDTRTRQRSAGKLLLPSGLRGFNTAIVLVISILAMGIFLFSTPISRGLFELVKLIGTGVYFVVKAYNLWFWGDDLKGNGGGGSGQGIGEQEALETNRYGELIMAVVIIVVLIILFILRKPIIEAIKGLFSVFGKKRKEEDELPYFDELSKSKTLSPRKMKKLRRAEFKRYEKETEPSRKYRMGYGLYLSELREAGGSPQPSDTTVVHAEKGESVFGNCCADIEEQRDVYGRIRYGDGSPSEEELARQKEMIMLINGNTK